MKIYAVGGALRDLLLGRGAADADFLVLDATPEEFLASFPKAREVGKSFPVYLSGGREYSWPRGGSLAEDLTARDLTINAIAQCVVSPDPAEVGRVSAHPLALADLRGKVLRPCSASSMSCDPLRVFRAARLAAVLPDFSLHPDLAAQMRACAADGQLEGVTAERVGLETRKALTAQRPGRFLEVLDVTGCLSPWFSELAGAGDIPAGPEPYHRLGVLGHTAAVMNALSGNPLAVWMGLAHDLGKTLTPREMLPKHHGHEKAGEVLALALGERLRLPERYVKAGVLASAQHMRAGRYLSLRPGTRVDLLVRAQAAGLFPELFALAEADREATGQAGPQGAVARAARRDLETIMAEHLPPEARDLGELSGRRLRELRCLALAGDGAKAKKQ